MIQGRFFDLQGQGVPDVTISVWSMELIRPSDPPGARPRFDGVSYYRYVNDLPAWPKPAILNAEGRFTLRGVGRNFSVVLTTSHPRFAPQRIQVETDSTTESKSMTATLSPAQIITGRVTCADTGAGVPHAQLRVVSGRTAAAATFKVFETEADGRFRINPPAADGWARVTAFPPPGQPYLVVVKASSGLRERSSKRSILPCRVASRSAAKSSNSPRAIPSRQPRSNFAPRRTAEPGGHDCPGQHRIGRLV